MNPIIQLAKALSEKYTYEEIRDYLNEGAADGENEIEFTLNGKKFTKIQRARDNGVALKVFYADGLGAKIITVPNGDIIAATYDNVSKLLDDMGIGGIEYEDTHGSYNQLLTINKNLMHHTHVKIPANGKLDLNKALKKVDLRKFKITWKEDGVQF